MQKKIITMLLSIMVSASLVLSACGTSTTDTETTTESAAAESSAAADDEDEDTVSAEDLEEGELVTPVSMIDEDSQFTDRDLDAGYDESNSTKINLSGSGAEVSGSGAKADGSTVTITEEGTYILSGTITDGQVIVDVADDAKVQLVLDGVTMSNTSSACILIENADKVFITLAAGSENTLSDTGAEAFDDYNEHSVTAVIYSRCDLVFNGSGELTIDASTDNGISCKDDLKFTDGTYNITAVGKGIRADESIRIKDGTFNITSDDDAIHVSEEETVGKGYVYICGGSFTLSSGDDGIHAATALLITDGDIDITESYEGLEGDTVDITGGNIDINASDDGINAALPSDSSSDFEDMDLDDMPEGMNHDNFDPSAFMQEGDTEDSGSEAREDASVASSDAENENASADKMGNPKEQMKSSDSDSEDSEQMQAPSGADGEMPTAPWESDNGEQMTPPDGSDDSESGQGGHGGGGMGGGMMLDVQENAYIRISGGSVTVTAAGDGVDSNGYIYFEGGTVIINGPDDTGNAAIDYGVASVITGGEIIAVGTSFMAESMDDSSTQYNIMYSFSETVDAGTEIIITDEDGNIVMDYTSVKSFDNVVFSSADLAEGTYTITAGDQTDTFTVESIVTSAGSSSRGMGGPGGGGMGGGPGGDHSDMGDGEMPDISEMPQMDGEMPDMSEMPQPNGEMPGAAQASEDTASN